MRLIILLSVMLGISVGIANSEIYKWKDKNGNIHFSDKPVANQNVEVHEPISSINIIDMKTPKAGQQTYKTQQLLNQVKSRPKKKTEAEKQKELKDWMEEIKKTPEHKKKWKEMHKKNKRLRRNAKGLR